MVELDFKKQIEEKCFYACNATKTEDVLKNLKERGIKIGGDEVIWKEDALQILNLEIEKIIREIYWKFRIAIHSGDHCGIRIEEGKIIPFKNDLKDTSCYVCDSIQNLEQEISSIFEGDMYYTVPKVIEADNLKAEEIS